MGSWDKNSGPHACKGSTSDESSPQPEIIFFNWLLHFFQHKLYNYNTLVSKDWMCLKGSLATVSTWIFLIMLLTTRVVLTCTSFSYLCLQGLMLRYHHQCVHSLESSHLPWHVLLSLCSASPYAGHSNLLSTQSPVTDWIQWAGGAGEEEGLHL